MIQLDFGSKITIITGKDAEQLLGIMDALAYYYDKEMDHETH